MGQTTPIRLGYAIVFKSILCEHAFVFECGNFTFSRDKKNNLLLKLYCVNSVHYNGKDVTPVCIINEGGMMTITNVQDGWVSYLYGEMNERLFNNINVKTKEQ